MNKNQALKIRKTTMQKAMAEAYNAEPMNLKDYRVMVERAYCDLLEDKFSDNILDKWDAIMFSDKPFWKQMDKDAKTVLDILGTNYL